MGLLVILLTAYAGGYDLLADPVGWALVLVGLRALPRDRPHLSTLRGLALLALVSASATWPGPVLERLDAAEVPVQWSVDLPELGFVVVLAHLLTSAAAGAGDRRASHWWSAVRTLTIVVGLLPVLVFGGGMTSLSGVAELLGAAVPLLVIGLLFLHGSRSWALAPDPVAAGSSGSSAPGPL